MRLPAAAILLCTLAGCAHAPGPEASLGDLVFLTRGDCVNTTAMRANFDAALKEMGLPLDYQFVALESLPSSDARTGYPTPTILHAGSDLFGMAAPTPPFPEPT